MGVIFDGTTRLGKALSIVLHFVSEDFEIKQRLIRLQLLAKSLTTETRRFVKATYKLEGDGPLVLQCYEVIDTVRATIKAANTPNILAVAEKLSGGVAHNKKSMIDHAQRCVQPAIDYFNGKLSSTLQRPLEAFKAARYSFINQSSKGFSIL